MSSLGFIMLRHVSDELTNKYWIYCYECIRNYYKENLIIIIDDNSNYEYITTENNLHNTFIINSEYHQRGELLPYYYYLQHKFFDTAVIIHDSVFINKYIDFNVDKYKIIWEFEHFWYLTEDEKKMLNIFNDKDLLTFYENKQLWKGCFGGMSVITFDFLKFINDKYDLSKLLNCVTNRYNRMCFERVIACLFQKEYKTESFFGNIHEYITWAINFNDIENYRHLPLIKIWSWR